MAYLIEILNDEPRGTRWRPYRASASVQSPPVTCETRDEVLDAYRRVLCRGIGAARAVSGRRTVSMACLNHDGTMTVADIGRGWEVLPVEGGGQ